MNIYCYYTEEKKLRLYITLINAYPSHGIERKSCKNIYILLQIITRMTSLFVLFINIKKKIKKIFWCIFMAKKIFVFECNKKKTESIYMVWKQKNKKKFKNNANIKKIYEKLRKYGKNVSKLYIFREKKRNINWMKNKP